MKSIRFWKTNMRNEAPLDDLTFDEAQYFKFQKSISTSDLCDISQSSLIEVLVVFTKIMALYEVIQDNLASITEIEHLKRIQEIKNQIKTQKVIVKTLFLLVDQKCATKDEISNCKFELIIKASKIEDKIIHLFSALTTKKEVVL